MPKYNINAITTIIITSILLVCIGVVYYDGAIELLQRWSEQEEYSYGYFIPFVVLYFIYQKFKDVKAEKFLPSWLGVGVVIIALIILLIGELSAIYVLVHYSFVIMLMGLILSYAGIKVLKHIYIPILILFFAVPLPYFIDSELSWNLQLISSRLGVTVIRVFNIPVYLEGNVIDLGSYKLQVVEACSGLSYLFPLMSIGFIVAYIYKAPMWQRTIVFLSTIPITVIMNSLRIGVIGILVTHWGTDAAEGFLHYFEGWVIFMVCLFFLWMEIWLLTKLRSDKPRLSDVFWVETSKRKPIKQKQLNTSVPFFVAVILTVLMTISVKSISDRSEIYPKRESFSSFPLEFGGWNATEGRLLPTIVQKLKVDDYYLGDFNKTGEYPVNLYIAYYRSQRKGVSPHSPRVCIPGGGWKISHLKEVVIKLHDGIEIPANRIVIEKNKAKQLVYYWFQQRGRKIANEYWMKWYLLHDSIVKNRTDGALVRFTTNFDSRNPEVDADKRTQEFINRVYPVLDEYIPK